MPKTLQTPIVNYIIPFDPKSDHVVNFTYGDNQSVKNRAVITDNTTNEIVYDEIQTTMRLHHTIPSDTLTAGNKYLIQIQVFDIDGNSSNLSTPVLFQCLSTPIFEFTNIQDGDVYKNASITLDILYSQSEGELMRNIQFHKYSTDKVLMDSSDVFYSSSTLSYSFYGLENGEIYYFRATGETNSGISLDTGYVRVDVTFQTVPFDAIFQVENHYKNGYITIDSNIVVVDYEIGNDNYTISNGLLDITNNTLTYKGFTIKEEDNFSLFLEAKKVPIGEFLKLDNGVTLSIIKVCGIYYCQLKVEDSDFIQYEPILYSSISDNYLEVINPDTLQTRIFGFILRRIDGYYGLEIYYK